MAQICCLKVMMLSESLMIEKPKRISRKANVHAGEVASPMLGNIVRVMAQDGNMVKAGEALLTISAMKMVSSSCWVTDCTLHFRDLI